MVKPVSFYGKRKKENEDETQEIKTEITSVKRLPKIEYSLLQPSSKRTTFLKQAEAVEYRGQDTSQTIFSWEYATGGVRKFLVTSPQTFWQFYSTEGIRHYYEVIAENCPCKFYLDVEFKIEDNPTLNGDETVDFLIISLVDFIKNKININISKDEILILDSTSETKFSNHLIFTTLVFQHNFQAGLFLTDFLKNLSLKQAQKFKVKKGDESYWIIDTGVYTKNRNFRLYLSSKYGRKEILDISANDLFSIKLIEENYLDPKFDREKSIFLESLVTLTKNLPVVQYNSSGAVIKRAKETPTPRLQKSRSLLTEGEKIESPYPEVDNFIKSLIEPTGFIRKWKISEDGSLVTYEIGGNRYCSNVDREHKSNNIKYVLNLEASVINQKCHDPDCREYRGPDIALPDNIFPWVDWSESDMLQSSQETKSSVSTVSLSAVDDAKSSLSAVDDAKKSSQSTNEDAKSSLSTNEDAKSSVLAVEDAKSSLSTV